MSLSIGSIVGSQRVALAAGLGLATLFASQVQAVPFQVDSGFGNGADTFVQLGSATNFGNSADLTIKDSGAGTTTRKAYIRFDLSGGSAAYINSQIDLTVSVNNEGGSGVTPQVHTVNVWGLRDGNAGENWDELTTVNSNAPANVPTNNFLTTGAVFLGQYTVPNTPTNGVNTFSSPNLDAFLSQDTNGSATIILQRTGGNGGHNLVYASDESAVRPGPVLSANAFNGTVLNITTNDGIGADAFVQQGAATTNFGNSALVIKGGAGSTARKVYTRFDLANKGELDALGAALTFDVAGNNTNGAAPPAAYTVEVFGLADGDAGEFWDESTINWNNAPANTTDNNLLANAILLGSFLVPASEVGYSVMFSSQEMLDFINSDENDAVTFIFRRTNGGGTNLTFASGESTAFNPPTLTLIMPAIPEPATALLGVIGLSALAARRRRMAA